MTLTVKCDDCNRARPVKEIACDVLGSDVLFGPAGVTDMFVHSDEGDICNRCIDDRSERMLAEETPNNV